MTDREFNIRFKLSDIGKFLCFSPVIVVLMYALICLPWGSEFAAGWVQAVGSVLALMGAIWLPIIHSKHAEKQRLDSTLGKLRIVAEDCYEQMWQLSSLFFLPGRDAKSMSSYLSNGRDKVWLPIERAVAGISISDIPPEHIKAFSDLQLAVEQSVFVVSRLRAWIEEGSMHPEIVMALRARRDVLGLVKGRFPWPEGVSDSGDKFFQKKFQAAEINRPYLEPYPLLGAKIFRRYCWDEKGYPSHVYVQVVFPFGNAHPVEWVLESDLPPGWRSLQEAERAVLQIAEEQITHESGDF